MTKVEPHTIDPFLLSSNHPCLSQLSMPRKKVFRTFAVSSKIAGYNVTIAGVLSVK